MSTRITLKRKIDIYVSIVNDQDEQLYIGLEGSSSMTAKETMLFRHNGQLTHSSKERAKENARSYVNKYCYANFSVKAEPCVRYGYCQTILTAYGEQVYKKMIESIVVEEI